MSGILLKIQHMPQFSIISEQARLIQVVQQIQEFLTKADALSEWQLLQQPASGGWSVAQVMEHLNVYSRHYLPLIEQAIKEEEGNGGTYRSGWLGEYFTKLMQPLPDGTLSKKMQSPANAQPVQALNAIAVKTAFRLHQDTLIALLQKAHLANWQKQRIPTSLSSWITLRLGDTLRFFVAHEYRHLLQMERILQQTS
jgi:uncharacterized damage-inducible protein DinB